MKALKIYMLLFQIVKETIQVNTTNSKILYYYYDSHLTGEKNHHLDTLSLQLVHRSERTIWRRRRRRRGCWRMRRRRRSRRRSWTRSRRDSTTPSYCEASRWWSRSRAASSAPSPYLLASSYDFFPLWSPNFNQSINYWQVTNLKISAC